MERKPYRRLMARALEDEFLRATLDAFARSYRAGRAAAFQGMDRDGAIRRVAEAKRDATARMEELYERFKEQAQARGATVHRAADAAQARELIGRIALERRCKRIIKSKSMTAEEIHLNHHLEALGLEVVETDLGEWIIQLRKERPSHMVLPAIHLSAAEVARLFTRATGREQQPEHGKLVKVARRELRRAFAAADMAVTGANAAIAETGTLAIVTNEGNARLATTLPRTHVALVGLDKLVQGMDAVLDTLDVLPRNATGQQITSYVTWISGAAPHDGDDKDLHVVFLDNGRSALARDPDFAELLQCVRCGACANVCPVYRLVGGHLYGYVYIGAVGLVLTYLLHGREHGEHLLENCLHCEACREVCAAGIDLPRLITAAHERLQAERGRTLPNRLLGALMADRRVFHTALRAASLAQAPLRDDRGYLRHLPDFFLREQRFRALPALAAKPFRNLESARHAPAAADAPVALFAGCLQDFVYPAHLRAAAGVLQWLGQAWSFPAGQSCCGLPLMMAGERAAARAVAVQNLEAFAGAGTVLTCCASCASFLARGYRDLVADDPDLAAEAEAFSAKVRDFSSYVWPLVRSAAAPAGAAGPRFAYHAPCHRCRGPGGEQALAAAPREVLQWAGLEYAPVDEEDVCCGLGGSYAFKFPGISRETLARKLDRVERSGAEALATDCPGCVMQLEGGLERRGAAVATRHVAELLAEACGVSLPS